MGQLTDAGYDIDDAGTLTTSLRNDIDSRLGPQDYDGTIEGARTLAEGNLAYGVEQGALIVSQMLDPRTASGNMVDVYAEEVGLTRRQATASRYIVRATVATGTQDLAVGDVLQDTATLVRWTVATSVTVTTSETLVTVDCQDTGVVLLASTATFRMVTPVANALTIAYDESDGDDFTVGRIRESDALLLVRRSRSLIAVPSPSTDGIRAGLLAIPWVVAASVVRQAAGVIKTTIYPAAVGADQEQEAINAIGFRKTVEASSYLTGADFTGNYTLSDGGLEPIGVFVGGNQNVAVAVTVTGTAESAAIVDAVAAVFAPLDLGGTIRYIDVYCAVAGVTGVTGITTLTLDGGTADVTASASTDFLVAVTTVS